MVLVGRLNNCRESLLVCIETNSVILSEVFHIKGKKVHSCYLSSLKTEDFLKDRGQTTENCVAKKYLCVCVKVF